MAAPVSWARPKCIRSPAKFGCAVPKVPVLKLYCMKSVATRPDCEACRLLNTVLGETRRPVCYSRLAFAYIMIRLTSHIGYRTMQHLFHIPVPKASTGRVE